jgi:hypothetical protein
VVDVVGGLALLVLADQRRVGLQGLVRVDHRRERVVVDVDQLQGVAGDVGVLGDHRRDLLALEHHLVEGQDRLGVARQGRHPRQAVGVQVAAGDDRDHARVGGGRLGVDGGDAGVGERGAQQRHVQHAGQGDVVDVVAAAAQEAVVLLAPHRVAEPADGGLGLAHACTSSRSDSAACMVAAAARTARTMFT